MMNLVDCHAHLEGLEDTEGAIRRAAGEGVAFIVAVGSDGESSQRALALAGRHGDVTVVPALGIHPWRLGSVDLEEDLAFVARNIAKAAAVGEVGLDFWVKEARKDRLHREAQEQLFKKLLSLARDFSKPVIVHARGAWEECLQFVLEAQVSKAVFHWFSGPLETLKEVLDQGFWISATPAAAYSEKHQRAVSEAPLARILLKTDSPVVYEGRRSEPADVLKTLRAVARIKQISETEVARVTTENAERFFSLRQQ
jgi:TatD DNase family protein